MNQYEIKFNGKKYQVYNSQELAKYIERDFRENLSQGMGKFPALRLALGKIPKKTIFVDLEVGGKELAKFIHNVFESSSEREVRK